MHGAPWKLSVRGTLPDSRILPVPMHPVPSLCLMQGAATWNLNILLVTTPSMIPCLRPWKLDLPIPPHPAPTYALYLLYTTFLHVTGSFITDTLPRTLDARPPIPPYPETWIIPWKLVHLDPRYPVLCLITARPSDPYIPCTLPR